MKLNISNPRTGQQKVIDVTEEHSVMHMYEKRMGAEVDGTPFGAEWAGCVFKIAGGNDAQGFPMMQGILKNSRVRLLFSKGMPCYRERRKGMRKRKSVRGCYVGHDIAVLALELVSWEKEMPGLTDATPVMRLGPKRKTKIRKMFGIDRTDDVRKYVVRREVTAAPAEGEEVGKKKGTKAPKIQRLVTKRTLQRKRSRQTRIVNKVIDNRKARKAYFDRVHDFKAAQKALRHEAVAKKKVKKA